MRTKDIALIGMMSAVLIVVQVALGFLPNIELVSLLILLFTLVFGRKTLFIIYIFVIAEGFIYGFGIWWFNYLYVWDVLYFIAMILRRKELSPTMWAIISGFYGLSFGTLCSIPYFFMGGVPTWFAYWIGNIPFDTTHAVSNFFITLILYRPLLRLLKLVKKRYDFLE